MSKLLEKSPEAFKTISEAAEELGVEQHVLRFWETKFSQIKPLKRRGGRRFYRPEDMETLERIKALLYGQGFTIKGAKKALSVKSPASVVTPVAEASATKGKKKAPSASQLDLLAPAVPAAAQEATPAPAGLSTAERKILTKALEELGDIRNLLQSAA